MQVKMFSKIYVIKEIKKKTQADGMKQFKVGDRIQFSTAIKNTTGCRGSYASYVTIHDLQTGKACGKTQSVLKNILDNSFELEEVNE